MKIKVLSTILGLLLSVGAFATTSLVSTNFNDALATVEPQGGKYGTDSIKCITELSLYQEAFKQWKKSGYKSAIVNELPPHWRWEFNNGPYASENTYDNRMNIVEK